MITADLNGIGQYIGAVGGILNAVESPGFTGNFISHMMGRVRTKFMADAIAANQSGAANIQHVFEWPDQDGSGVSTGMPSSVPLFKLTKMGRGDNRALSYEFLPSTKYVPLPDPAKYGFKPEKLGFLNRAVFKFKAIVMEMDSAVTIAPTRAKKLFIPDAKAKYGYYMTSSAQNINPGGAQATGGFANFWTMWFESRAQAIVTEETHLAGEVIKASGQAVVRYAAGTVRGGKNVGGRFARGEGVSFGYVEAATRNAEIRMSQQLENYYPEEDDWY